MGNNHMTQEKEYFAFISYQRKDEEWAKWLQHKLEHYKLPSNLNGRTDLPKEIRPVFKDTSELTPGNLPEQIRHALEQSKYLIVICSPRSAKSEWVNKEIETFISLDRTTRIIPFIIKGRAFAATPEEECFPLSLRQLPEEQEVLGTNVNEMGREAAAVKVVARMFDVRFDELWHRHEREEKRRRNILITAVTMFVLGILGVAGWIWHQNQELKQKNYQVMLGQSRYIAGTASMLADDGETYLARLLALEVLENNPYTPEAEAALRKACMGNSTVLSDKIYPIMAIFSPKGKWVAAIAQDSLDAPRNLYLWDSNSGKLMFVIPTNQDHVKEIAFNASEDIVQTSDSHGDAKQWKIPEGTICKKKVPVIVRNFYLPEFCNPQSTAMGAVYSPDSTMIAVAYREGVTRLWDTATHQCIQTFDEEDLAVWGVDFCPDGKRLLITAEHCLRICDIARQSNYLSLDGYELPIWKVLFSPDDNYLIAVYGTGAICCWDTDKGQQVWEYSDDDYFDIPQTIEFEDKGSEIKIIYADGTCLRLNSADGNRSFFSKGTMTANDDEEEELGNTEAFSADGKTMATVIDDRSVVIYNTDSNEEICLLHKDYNNDIHAEVVSIAFSHNSRYIAVGTMNGCLKIYTFPPLQELIDSNRNRFKNRHLTTEERKKFYLE